MSEYYNHLEGLILAHGYKNVTQFSNASGVPRSNFTEIAKGRSPMPKIENGIKIAECLGETLDTVYNFHKQKTAPAYSAEALLVAAAFDTADDKSKDMVLLALREYLETPATKQAVS